MNDWRRSEMASQSRTEQRTGRGASNGLFMGAFDTASGADQTGMLKYAGGARSIAIPMPFDSVNSWIRCIPEASSGCLLGYRTDNQDLAFVNYMNDKPSNKLNSYTNEANLYRPLLSGEIDIMSVGYAGTYYSSRPDLEHRGGVVRSWLDQDRAESGAKAPLHCRQIWEHLSAEIGDEERFGVVRRPLKLSGLGSLVGTAPSHSSNFYNYPFPDYSLPGGVPAAYSLVAQAVATASKVVSSATGTFEIRPFAKEYMRVIKNPLSPIPPDVLIDIREGQVFDDDGKQVTSDSGAYVRAQYQYFTPFTDATMLTIDELGNTYLNLSLAATDGYSIDVPLGSYTLTAATGIDMSTYAAIGLSSELGTSIEATTTVDISSTLSMSLDSSLDMSLSASTGYTMSSDMNADNSAQMNYTIKAGINFEATADTSMALSAPMISIGQSASDPMLMGTAVMTTLTSVFNAMLTSASKFTVGNLGYPTILDSGIVQALTQAITDISSVWPSTSITVGP